MECDHCKSIFKTLSSLNYHKQNAKYCLKVRNESNTTFKCEFCLKNLSTKHCLDLHKNKCKSNIDFIKNQNIALIDKNKQLNIMNDMLQTKVKEQTITYWEQNYPLSKGDGVLILMAAYNKAPKEARKSLIGELQKATNWINSRPSNGIDPVQRPWIGDDYWRIDLEVWSGKAFITVQPKLPDYDPRRVI